MKVEIYRDILLLVTKWLHIHLIKVKQKIYCAHRRKGIWGRAFQAAGVFLFPCYFKTIMKNADPGWIFYGGWVDESCSHLAVLVPLFHLRGNWLCVVEGNKDMEWQVSWLRADCHTRHTYVWIFHVQPQSEQQKTLMFVYTSVLPYCIQVSLIMTYCSNTKASHWPTRSPLLENKTFIHSCYGEGNLSKISKHAIFHYFHQHQQQCIFIYITMFTS